MDSKQICDHLISDISLHREFTNLKHHINQQHSQVKSSLCLKLFSQKWFKFSIFTVTRNQPRFIYVPQLKKYKCGDCGYSCYLKTDLERHIANVHDKVLKKVHEPLVQQKVRDDQLLHFQCRTPCPICGKKYSDLRQHIRLVHEGHKVDIRNSFPNFATQQLYKWTSILNKCFQLIPHREFCFSWSVRNVERSTQI